METVRHKNNLLYLNIGTVGKTSVFTRLIKNEYKDISIKARTIEACSANKAVKVNDKIYMTNLWDTAGEEKYRALTPMYYRNSDAALLLFDITKRESFDRIEKWIQELLSSNSNIKIVICANKSDLVDDYQINEEQIKEYAERLEALHFKISAKTGENIEECYAELIKKVCQRERRKSTKRTNILVNYNPDPKKNEKKSCC